MVIKSLGDPSPSHLYTHLRRTEENVDYGVNIDKMYNYKSLPPKFLVQIKVRSEGQR